MQRILRVSGKRSIIAGLVILVLAVGSALLIANRAAVYNLYEDVLLDNKSLAVPCADLPSLAEAQATFASQQPLVATIQAVPGFVSIDVTDFGCPGKGYIRIWYGSHAARQAIERIIGADTFFGVPYTLTNV